MNKTRTRIITIVTIMIICSCNVLAKDDPGYTSKTLTMNACDWYRDTNAITLLNTRITSASLPVQLDYHKAISSYATKKAGYLDATKYGSPRLDIGRDNTPIHPNFFDELWAKEKVQLIMVDVAGELYKLKSESYRKSMLDCLYKHDLLVRELDWVEMKYDMKYDMIDEMKGGN